MNWSGAFGRMMQQIRPRQTDAGNPGRRRPSISAAPGTPAKTAGAELSRDTGDLFLDRRVFAAMKESIVRHNARHPDWRIAEVRCMPCSVTRGLGLRDISDLDGLTFYVENRRGIVPPPDWTALKTELQNALSAAGIHFGGNYDPVSDLTLVQVDGRQRIAGHLFRKDETRMPAPEEEHISTLVLFKTDNRGQLVEMAENTSCARRRGLLSTFGKLRGLSKCEARLRLAYLLGALPEADLREALTFETPEDEARLPHLRLLRQRMFDFLASRPVLSPAAASFLRQLHAAMAGGAPDTVWTGFLSGQDPKVLRRALCELLRHRLLKVDATGSGILPLWHQKLTLLVDDDQNRIALPLPDGKAAAGGRGMLARAEAGAWRLDHVRMADASQARRIVAQPEPEVDPFLRDCAVKYLGVRMDVRDVPRLIGVLGDQYDVAAGSAITLLARADAPDLPGQLCRTIDEQWQNEAFCTNAISVLGKTAYPDARKRAAVVAFLQKIISGGWSIPNAGLRIRYSGVLALQRLSRQDCQAQTAIRNYVDALAAERKTPKIIAGLIRNLFSAETGA